MKIKTKKEMNLPELIEWGFENDVTNTWYRASNVEEYISEVFFDATGLPQFSNTVNKNDTFTVEVEERIDEDTKINKLLVKFKSPSRYQMFSSDCINGFEIEEGNIEAFYVLNDDLTLTLIWTKEKGLIS